MKNLKVWFGVVGLILLGCYGMYSFLDEDKPATSLDEDKSATFRFTNAKTQTSQFYEYYRSITLTAEQEAVFREALSGIPAPCCSDQTAYTCCCKCNLGRSWWGLSKHLIADKGYDAAHVENTVKAWFEFINPAGFSGKTCYVGGCDQSFHAGGCGGMKETQLNL